MARGIIKAHDSQILTLILTYKFRHISAPLLARLRGISQTATKNTLNVLYKKGLLNRKYDKSYKLLGRPASYSLNITGVNYLKERMKLNQAYAHTHYSNAKSSDRFIGESLDIFRTYIILNETYPDTFTIITKAEMSDYSDNFLKPLPHLFINRIKSSDVLPNYYMLEILNVTSIRIIAARVAKYIKHFEDGDWEEDEHPVILLVLADKTREKEALKITREKKDNAFIEDDDLVFMTTTVEALFSSNKSNIWTSHSRKLISL